MNKISRNGIYSPGISGRIYAAAAGSAAGAAGAMIMFPYTGAVIASALICAVAAVPVSARIIFRRRHEKVRRQFRDFLDSLCGAFSGGCNAREAFERAYRDICFSYGKKAVFVREIGDMLEENRNGRSLGEILSVTADRLEDSSFNDFAETFSVCIRNGGNLMTVAAECRDIINSKIDAERETALCTVSNRNELNILTVMPFVITLIMNTTGADIMTGAASSMTAARIVCVILTAAAYFIGMKITGTEV